MSGRYWWLMLALTPIFFLLAVQPSVDAALADQLKQLQQLITVGKTWLPAKPSHVIGGQPVGNTLWQRGADGLTLQKADSRVYLPLNFDGLRLPTQALKLIELDLSAAQSAQLKLYHRAQLSGPAAGSKTIDIAPGRQTLELDATSLNWSIDGQSVAWGQQHQTLATLRIHPYGQPAVITLHRISLHPLSQNPPPDQAAARISGSASPPDLSELSKRFWWSTAKVRNQLDSFHQKPALWGQAQINQPRLPHPGWIAALGLGLLVALVRPALRPAAALALLMLSVWWCFSQPRWEPGYLAVAAASLALCIVLSRLKPSAPSRQHLPPTSKARSLVDLAILMIPLAMLMALFIASLLSADGGQWSVSPLRWLTYLLWAMVQQWVVCTVLFPLARRAGLAAAPAIATVALIFGLTHLPNMELMLLTWLLALACLWHFNRHQKLFPAVALHVMAGSLLLAAAPLPLIYSASAGPGFWG